MSSSSAFNFGTSDPDAPFEFEDIPYPSHHWSAVNREEELPLHYMSEEKARRRVKAPAGPMLDPQGKEPYGEYYDDEGKDVYNKMRPKNSRLSSGRLPQPPLPPPTSVVNLFFFFFCCSKTNGTCFFSDRIYLSKPRTLPTYHLHSSFLLDEISQNWCIQYRRLG